MDKQAIKKVSAISFMAAAAVTWLTVTVLLKALAGSFGVVQRLYSSQLVSHGLPIALAVGLFAFLYMSPKIQAFTEEVILEVSKVVWPSRKDVIGMTIVVIVMVFIASAILLGVDTVAREVVKLLVQSLGSVLG
jgi:preprotein translocase subunit SecE